MLLGLYWDLLRTAVRSDSESVAQPGIVTILSTEGDGQNRSQLYLELITYVTLP